MEQIFLNDLLPIFVILLLGYIAGKRSSFSEDNAQAFNRLVLDYALPAALFISIVKADRAMLFADMSLTLASTVILIVCFFLSYFCCKKIFKHDRSEASVAAMIAGSPTVGVLGFATLSPIYGSGTITGLVVAIVAIVQHVLVIPFGVYLMHPTDENGNKRHRNPIIASLKEPIVIVPILAIVLVLLDIKFPPALTPSLNLIAYAKSGLAIFAAGVTLSVHQFELDGEVIFNTLLKLILMPAIALAIALSFGIRGEILQMLVLISALPPSFSGAIIGNRYQVYIKTGTSTLACSMLFFMLAAPLWIIITRYISA
ncbi:AEC family transporter [Utexia brackfieldae]|uniref:AEC family transporter n=1 Tax=Utexia brackfieldae TaxID=3074108 RepID=UPI00370D6EB1